MEIGENGERNFSFARKPGADTQLKKEELDQTLISGCRIFHFGSLSLTDEPAESTTIEAVKMAKAAPVSLEEQRVCSEKNEICHRIGRCHEGIG